MVQRDSAGRFVVGHRSMGGRPKGQKNRLAEIFFNDVYELWIEKGRDALDLLISEDPMLFVRLVGASIPKEVAASIFGQNNEGNLVEGWSIKLIDPKN